MCAAKAACWVSSWSKDKQTKEPFDQAGKMVYQKAFRKGLAWVPAGHILRMRSAHCHAGGKLAQRGMDLIEEAIAKPTANC